MARSAHFEGGRNTLTRVFPAGADGANIVGVMPKDGKVKVVRVHGDADETDLTAQVRVYAQDGSGPTNITAAHDVDADFTSAQTARAGTEIPISDQEAADLLVDQLVEVNFGSTSGSVGEIAVLVGFDPR